MKKNILTSIAIGFATVLFAQKTPEVYLKTIPALPKDSCSVTNEEVSLYMEKVQTLIIEINNDIHARNQKADACVKSNKAVAQENAAKQLQQTYGMSDADINKMKNSKNMSDAEKKELANKMMMQQTNMSVDEAKNLQNMSEAGRTAYAEAYAMEAMATNDPNAKQPANIQNSQNIMELTKQQQTLNNELVNNSQTLQAQYDAIDNDAEAQKMLNNIQKFRDKEASYGTIITAAQVPEIDTLEAKIKREQIKYCAYQTPKYRAQLRVHLANVKERMPENRKIGETNIAVLKAETGIDLPSDTMDIACLESIVEYLKRLKDVNKYVLYFPE